jgi:hypothetical protein
MKNSLLQTRDFVGKAGSSEYNRILTGVDGQKRVMVTAGRGVALLDSVEPIPETICDRRSISTFSGLLKRFWRKVGGGVTDPRSGEVSAS